MILFSFAENLIFKCFCSILLNNIKYSVFLRRNIVFYYVLQNVRHTAYLIYFSGGRTMKTYEIDDIDRKILRHLQANARTPLKEIAAEVFLSSPAVSARISNLENLGYIRGYHAEVDPVALGYHIRAFINLEVAPVDKKEFYPYIQSCRNVIECNCVTGDYSMLLEGMFHSTNELDQFINELQRFGRTKTLIVFSTSVEHRGVEIK